MGKRVKLKEANGQLWGPGQGLRGQINDREVGSALLQLPPPFKMEINLLSQANNPTSLLTMSLESATQAKISAEDNLIIAGDYDTNDNGRQEE